MRSKCHVLAPALLQGNNNVTSFSPHLKHPYTSRYSHMSKPATYPPRQRIDDPRTVFNGFHSHNGEDASSSTSRHRTHSIDAETTRSRFPAQLLTISVKFSKLTVHTVNSYSCSKTDSTCSPNSNCQNHASTRHTTST